MSLIMTFFRSPAVKNIHTRLHSVPFRVIHLSENFQGLASMSLLVKELKENGLRLKIDINIPYVFKSLRISSVNLKICRGQISLILSNIYLYI